MSDDLLRRARAVGGFDDDAVLISDLADEIVRLKQLYMEAEVRAAAHLNEIERLRAALRLITQTAPFGQPQGIARKALGEEWKSSAALGEKE